MWIPKGVALIRVRHLFKARRLLEEIRSIYLHTYDSLFHKIISLILNAEN